MTPSKFLLLSILTLLFGFATCCRGAEVLVVADTRVRPVAEIVAGVGQTLKSPFQVVAPSRTKGTLEKAVEKENAKVVVALGKEALKEALRLPSSVLVIYDLLVIPPTITRENTTGFYMATPAREYAELLGSHLAGFNRIAVVGSRSHLGVLSRGDAPPFTNYLVKNTYEFVNTLRRLSGINAILLLPDASFLSSTAMEQAYLLSFRKKIPILGISEKNVKDGSLLALVADPVQVGRQIGEYVVRALKGGSVGEIPPAPPKKFDLFVNMETARKMGIRLPEELVRNAKRIYP